MEKDIERIAAELSKVLQRAIDELSFHSDSGYNKVDCIIEDAESILETFKSYSLAKDD